MKTPDSLYADAELGEALTQLFNEHDGSKFLAWKDKLIKETKEMTLREQEEKKDRAYFHSGKNNPPHFPDRKGVCSGGDQECEKNPVPERLCGCPFTDWCPHCELGCGKDKGHKEMCAHKLCGTTHGAAESCPLNPPTSLARLDSRLEVVRTAPDEPRALDRLRQELSQVETLTPPDRVKE